MIENAIAEKKPSLAFPAVGSGVEIPATLRRSSLTKKRAFVSAWPWQETMLTAGNSYLLWAFTWLQFVIIVSLFSYRGNNLWLYIQSTEPTGLTIPELFLTISIALSVFAVAAIIGATWKTPRLWKRIFTVGLFAFFAIGLSCLNLHLRHYCYAAAVRARELAFESYHRNLVVNYQSTDRDIQQALQWDKLALDQHDELISDYEEKYQIEVTK